jgi:hypothetical protein
LPEPVIVSVESRKGGVGKTTAALNLARILLETGRYAVLFLDVDITGTNAVDGLGPSYWQGITHKVMRARKHAREVANLLGLFDSDFMTQGDLPAFGVEWAAGSQNLLSFDPRKINVLGSQIYNDSGSSETTGRNEDYICDPRILFDELHAFWFVEFLQSLCGSFCDAVEVLGSDLQVAIVIDNSPGYVGFAPSIQDWLTDLGPRRGKFLMVTSLDPQDVRSVARALEGLHRLYSYKWRAAAAYRKMLSSEQARGVELSSLESEFFERLVEVKSSSAARHSDAGGEACSDISFYLDSSTVDGEMYEFTRSRYMALIINRLPRHIGRRLLKHNLDVALRDLRRESAVDPKSPMLVVDDLLREISLGRGGSTVIYDEDIEYQFLVPVLEAATSRESRRRKRLRRRLPSFIEEQFSALEGERVYHTLEARYGGDRETTARVLEYIGQADSILTRAASLLEDHGLSSLARSIRPEWKPSSIFDDVKDTLGELFEDVDYSDAEMDDQQERFSRRSDNGEAKSLFYEFVHRSLSERLSSGALSAGAARLVVSTLSAVAAIAVPQPWRTSPTPQLARLMDVLHSLLAAELDSLPSEQTDATARVHLAESLARLGFGLEGRYHTESPTHAAIDSELSVRLSRQVPLAQSRLLAMREDVHFMLSLIESAVSMDASNEPALPNLQDSANAVIIERSASHKDALRGVAEALRAARHMRNFSQVLHPILSAWDLLK